MSPIWETVLELATEPMIVQPILAEAVMREMRKAPIGDKDQQWAVARKNDVFCARKSGGSSRVDQRMQTCREAAEQWNQHIQRFITFNRYLPHGVKGMIGSVKRACRSSLQRLILHKIDRKSTRLNSSH